MRIITYGQTCTVSRVFRLPKTQRRSVLGFRRETRGYDGCRGVGRAILSWRGTDNRGVTSGGRREMSRAHCTAAASQPPRRRRTNMVRVRARICASQRFGGINVVVADERRRMREIGLTSSGVLSGGKAGVGGELNAAVIWTGWPRPVVGGRESAYAWCEEIPCGTRRDCRCRRCRRLAVAVGSRSRFLLFFTL